MQVNAPKEAFDTDDEENMSGLESEEELDDNESNNARQMQPSTTSSESEITFPKRKTGCTIKEINKKKERLIAFDEIEEFLLKNKDIMDRVHEHQAMEESEDGSDVDVRHQQNCKSVNGRQQKDCKNRRHSGNSVFDNNM